MKLRITNNKGTGENTKVFWENKDITDKLDVHKIEMKLKAGDLNEAVLHCWVKETDLTFFSGKVIVRASEDLSLLAFDIKEARDYLEKEEPGADPHVSGILQGFDRALELIKRYQEKQ